MKGPVICGVDDANVTTGAIEVARDLAQRYELPLLYARVLHHEEDGDAAEQLVRDLAAPGHVEIAIESGHPADRLVALALERQASFLVVGNHGARASVLGSISADVSRRAPCPVVVVPPTAEVADIHDPVSERAVEGGIVRFSLSHAAAEHRRAPNEEAA